MPCDRAWVLTAAGILAWATSGFADEQTLEERRARLERMPAVEKEELLRKKERFERLPSEEQQRLRQLHTAIHADTRARRLRQVMLRYHEWLKTLPSGQRAELLGLPAADRVQEIQRVVAEQQRQQFNELTSRKLLPADHAAILTWLNDLVGRQEAELLEALPHERKERLRQLNPRDRRRSLMFSMRRRMGPERSVIDRVQLSDEDVQRLAQELSEDVRQTLDEVQGEQDRKDLLRRWVNAALFSHIMPAVNSSELKPFYDSLAPAMKEHLENLPRDRMMNELRRLYVKKRFEERRRPGFRGGEKLPRGRRP